MCSRGSIVGRARGLPPVSVGKAEDRILMDYERLFRIIPTPTRERWFVLFGALLAFQRYGVLRRLSAELARKYGVHLHTHLGKRRMKKYSVNRNLATGR